VREITLLCSAAATGLTKAAVGLAQLDRIVVSDLEEDLKGLVDWTQFKGAPANMGTLCSRSDRDTVLDFWQKAPKKSKTVLACHLTLFSPSRLEFYSPPLLRELLKQEDVKVGRVIVLIDDIYDMHERLAAPGNLYSHDRALNEHRLHASRLTGRSTSTQNVNEFSDEEIASLGVEITTKNLLRLLHWRRAEMIAAEELARNLGAQLTVLAVKHDKDALTQLVTNEVVWPELVVALLLSALVVVADMIYNPDSNKGAKKALTIAFGIINAFLLAAAFR
jgi:hypothetical protein